MLTRIREEYHHCPSKCFSVVSLQVLAKREISLSSCFSNNYESKEEEVNLREEHQHSLSNIKINEKMDIQQQFVILIDSSNQQ